MWLDLFQSDGTLTGTNHFNGDIYDSGYDRKYYQSGKGTVEGTLASGPTPRVSLTLTPDDCPGRVMSYQGTYNAGSRQISIAGSLLLSTELCDPLVGIAHSTILQRD